jgi:hypothetical protein
VARRARDQMRPVIAMAIAALSVVLVAPAVAGTMEIRYTPLGADGTLRDGLRATPAFGGNCSTGSFLVAGPGAFRCVQDSFIHDPCYLDVAAGNAARSVVVCVETPWSPNVLRLRVKGPLDPRYAARPDGPPWALRLASGRRCVLVAGAAPVAAGRRMNYACGRRYLFGSPDRTQPTWRIAQALTPGGAGLRKVAIAAAWR